MNLITLESVSLSYGEKILLNSIDFRVNQGDRIALIAQNGSGKSTLMKIMCGLVAPEGEQARVLTAPGIRIGYLDQEPEFEADMAIRDVLMGIDHPQIAAWANHYRASVTGDAVALQKASIKMDDLQGWDT